jgi:hypothetical protein
MSTVISNCSVGEKEEDRTANSNSSLVVVAKKIYFIYLDFIVIIIFVV